MPQHDKKKTDTDPAATEAKQGLSLVFSDVDDPMCALEIARDYRGDTTIHLKDGTSLTYDLGGTTSCSEVGISIANRLADKLKER